MTRQSKTEGKVLLGVKKVKTKKAALYGAKMKKKALYSFKKQQQAFPEPSNSALERTGLRIFGGTGRDFSSLQWMFGLGIRLLSRPGSSSDWSQASDSRHFSHAASTCKSKTESQTGSGEKSKK